MRPNPLAKHLYVNYYVSRTLPVPVGTSSFFKLKYVVYTYFNVYILYILNYNSLQFLMTCVALQVLHVSSLFFIANLHDRGRSFNFTDEDTEV